MNPLLQSASLRRPSHSKALLTGAAALVAFSLADPSLADDSFSAPTGLLGANLSFDSERAVRMHGEMSYHTQSSLLTVHALAWTLGVGVKLGRSLELEATLPIGGLVIDQFDDRFGVGNLALGANYFGQPARGVRLKVGGGVALGPWNQDSGFATNEGIAVSTGLLTTRAYQDPWLTIPNAVHLFAPARIELGDTVRFTGDAAIDLALPTSEYAETDVYLLLGPGIAYWATDGFNFGARFLIQLQSNDNDEAQLTLEPYARLDFGEGGFLSSRFTVNLDEGLGFSFDPGKFWGLHLAAGAAF